MTGPTSHASWPRPLAFDVERDRARRRRRRRVLRAVLVVAAAALALWLFGR